MRALILFLAVVGQLSIARAASAHSQAYLVHVRGETQRLQAHFDQVLAELAARPVADLSPAQRRARAVHIERLREYRDAGEFPRNEGQASVQTPIFRDYHGTLCAMGYLIARSGAGDLVDAVAASRNLATIAELSDEPRLVDWLHDNGLTLAEASRIQPGYYPTPAAWCFCSRGPGPRQLALLEITAAIPSRSDGASYEYETMIVDRLSEAIPAALADMPVRTGDIYEVGQSLLADLQQDDSSQWRAEKVLPVDAEGGVSCGPAALAQGGLGEGVCHPELKAPLELAFQSLRATDCEATLRESDPRWTQSCRDRREGCTAASPATDSANVAALAGLVALVAVGVRRQRR